MMRKYFCSLRIFAIFVKTHFLIQQLISKVFEKFMKLASKFFSWWEKISACCKNLHPWFCSLEKTHSYDFRTVFGAGRQICWKKEEWIALCMIKISLPFMKQSPMLKKLSFDCLLSLSELHLDPIMLEGATRKFHLVDKSSYYTPILKTTLTWTFLSL